MTKSKKAQRAKARLDTLKKIISDDEINKVWGNANFGEMCRRTVIAYAVLKCGGGYYQGYTSKTICQELGLIGKNYTLTKKGKKYMFWAWESGEGV